MRSEMKFRAWDQFNGVYYYSDKFKNLAKFFLEVQKYIDGGNDIVTEQYSGQKDICDSFIYQNDLLNIFFSSGDGKYIHDCVFKAEFGQLGSLEFRFVKLLWESHGHNQYPISQTLSERFGSLSLDQSFLYLPDEWNVNRMSGDRWKSNDDSRFFKVIGNIHEHKHLLELNQEEK